jgi:hypothetical protein
LKPKCTTAIVRKVTRDVDEEVRDRVRALANTEAFQQLTLLNLETSASVCARASQDWKTYRPKR